MLPPTEDELKSANVWRHNRNQRRPPDPVNAFHIRDVRIRSNTLPLAGVAARGVIVRVAGLDGLGQEECVVAGAIDICLVQNILTHPNA
jgi:hypothetical protein